MKVRLLGISDSWQNIKNAAMNTMGKEEGVYPSSLWKRRLLLCEHSPIRKLKISWKWIDLKSWISVHFVRHKLGIEHFVSTQRTDRTGIDRNALRQDELVSHECEGNAQAMIFISRRRLCGCASPETRDAWKAVLESIKEREPELYSVCVPDCIYRGYCYEYKSCNHFRTDAFKYELERYRSNINEIHE